ncbi:MAG: 50S ribosomal protein L15 [bacterium]
MDLGNLKPSEGCRKRPKRVGRGIGSGLGKTCGRGMNGQKSRSGSKSRVWFEGGQMPIQRRVPKRGFTNIFRREYQVVNIQDLEKSGLKQVNLENMLQARLIRKKNQLVKILGKGELTKSIEVKAHTFSASAVKKIEKAGGKAIYL